MIKIGIVGNPIVRWALSSAINASGGDLEIDGHPDVLLVWIGDNAADAPWDLSLTATDFMGMKLPCIAIGRPTDPAFAACAILAGAAYYVSETEAPRTLIQAARDAAAGTLIIPPEVADLVKMGGPIGPLTLRERQVLKLLVASVPNPEIAAQLKINIKTVDTHRTHLLNKLGLSGNVALTKFAIRYGYATL